MALEADLRERLRAQEFRLHELMMKLPEGASVPTDDLVTALVEWEDLRDQLKFLQNGEPGQFER
jgi:hypothetical protein